MPVFPTSPGKMRAPLGSELRGAGTPSYSCCSRHRLGGQAGGARFMAHSNRRSGMELSNLERYQRIAMWYDLLDLPFEYGRYRHIRPRLFQGLFGRILDAGVGTGRNIPFYPPDARVLGFDLSPAMLARATRRRKQSTISVELRELDITRLGLPDATFDAAVATFLFCVLPDDQQLAGLRELARVVKAGGSIRLLEYVRPRQVLRRYVSRLWQPWITWAYGASFDRNTEVYVHDAGLELTASHFVVQDLIKLIELRVPV